MFKVIQSNSQSVQGGFQVSSLFYTAPLINIIKLLLVID